MIKELPRATSTAEAGLHCISAAGRVEGLGSRMVEAMTNHDGIAQAGRMEGIRATRGVHSTHALLKGDSMKAASLSASWFTRLDPLQTQERNEILHMDQAKL